MKDRGGLKFPTEPPMNTITIEDPREARKRAVEALPGATYVRASFAEHDGEPQWCIAAFFPQRRDLTAHGKTIDEAIAAARKIQDEQGDAALAKVRDEWIALGCPDLKRPD